MCSLLRSIMSPTKEDGVERKRKAQDELEEARYQILGLGKILIHFSKQRF